eukprot:gene11755-11901_t
MEGQGYGAHPQQQQQLQQGFSQQFQPHEFADIDDDEMFGFTGGYGSSGAAGSAAAGGQQQSVFGSQAMKQGQAGLTSNFGAVMRQLVIRQQVLAACTCVALVLSTSSVAAAPTLLGTDGPELTQVAAAQQLGLTGRGTTICVIDTGINTHSGAFGESCLIHTADPGCRVAFEYDAETEGNTAAPNLASGVLALHGQHVANIALGRFPNKLFDAEGAALPHQSGVAPGAKLGAVRAVTSAMQFPPELTLKALNRSVHEQCDVINLSMGGFHVMPNHKMKSGMQQVAAAGILMTAAAGNDDQAPVWGSRLFNVASPATFKSAFAVAHVNSSAGPGAILQLDMPILTPTGLTSTVTAIQRADTAASFCQGPTSSCRSNLQFPLAMHLLQLLNAGNRSSPAVAAAAAAAQQWQQVIPASNAEVLPQAAAYPGLATADDDAPQCTLFRSDSQTSIAGQVVVMQFDADCTAYQTDYEVWDMLVGLKPALVLVVVPQDSDAATSILYDRNKQVPVLWLQSTAGQALAGALLEAATNLEHPPHSNLTMQAAQPSDISPEGAFHQQLRTAPRLMSWPSAAVVAFLKDDHVPGQPAETSCLGPAYDLGIKPDIAAPGVVYSGLPVEGSYQTWPGTSQASPYLAGVLALWKEQQHRRQLAGHQGAERVASQGWIKAAFVALKNTARPVRYWDSKLYWPPAKLGAGVLQAHATVLTEVQVTPPELLLRTDRVRQALWLSVTNDGSSDIAYTVQHKPAVTMSLTKSWYAQALDTAVATAQVKASPEQVVVPAYGSSKIKVIFAIPAELQALHAIISGYITLTPAAGGPTAAQHPAQLTPASPIELSIPYQGSTKDYSTLGKNNSLALFAPVMSEVDATAAEILARYPEIYVCHGPSEIGCQYRPGDASVVHATAAADAPVDVTSNSQSGSSTSSLSRGNPQAAQMAIRFGATLLRPVRDVKVQVWTSDGASWLGTSGSLGPAANTAPWKRTYLTEGPWDGTYMPAEASQSASSSAPSATTHSTSRASTTRTRSRASSRALIRSRSGRTSTGAQERAVIRGKDDYFVDADVAEHDARGWQQLAAGQSYSLRVELHPVLAAGDKAAGRLLQAPFVYQVAGGVNVVADQRGAAAAEQS